MRNYVKPESALIALNMNENIAASAEYGPESASFESVWKSDPSVTYVSNSHILWAPFKAMAGNQSGIKTYLWMKEVFGDIEFDKAYASCLNLD